MTKRTLIALIFIVLCIGSNAQTPTDMDCKALKERIDNTFKNSTSIRTVYWSREREIYVDYDKDAAASSHLVVENRGKKFVRQILIEVKGKKYYTKDKNSPDANVWESKIPTSFNETGWMDSCTSAKAVFNLPFDNCFLSKEKMITGTPFSIYSIKIAKDTFDVWLNKTTDKLERITGANKLKMLRFEWNFDVPFTISTPPKDLEDNPKFGTNMFPPSYVYDEFDGNERVLIAVDKNAEYKGGQMEMFKYLSRNIKYPKDARESNKQGTVYIGFVVEKNGKLTNFNLKRGVSPDCNEEAMRVTKLMSGDWEAGLFDGQKVRQAFTLPIKFKLE